MAKDKVKTGTALINVEESLKAQALIARATEESVQTGQFFGTQGGILTFNGAPIKDNKMQCIIVDHILANLYYIGKFNSKDPKPPVCYAFGRDDKQMAPHENSSEKQAEVCQGCPQNEFGTADTGRGKACKNARRLAVISASLLEEPASIADAQVGYLATPVTSVKGWAGYVRQVADTFGVPPLGVVTEVSLVPDTDKQFKMTFRCVEKIADKKVLALLLAKQVRVAKEIAFPFPELEDRPQPSAATKRPKAGAKVSGGKAAAAAPAGKAKGGKAAGGFGAARKY